MSGGRTVNPAVAEAVTALFVPGDRPERFDKAAAARPDVVVIDLEDAVAPASKAQALDDALAALGANGASALVRVNAIGSETHGREVEALLGLAATQDHGLLGLMVPKAEESPLLRELVGRCAQARLAVVLLVESAAGILDARPIAGIPGVTRLAFGAIDYALDIDAEGEDRILDYPRNAVVVASRAASIAAPLDSPTVDIRGLEAVEASARLARSFGFGGKLCIHPAQLSPVKAAFAPTDDDARWAEAVLAAGAGAAQIDGQMVDRPVFERARRILARTGKEIR